VSRIKTIALMACVFVALSCNEGPKDVWVKALKECAETDINSDKILYFGPSNVAGPGSGWRETFDARGRHVDYRLRWSPSKDMPPPRDWVDEPGDSAFQCKSGQSVKFELKVNVAADVKAFPLNAEVSNDLSKAKKVDVSVAGMAWEPVREGPYRLYYKNTLGPTHPVYEDMDSANRYVLIRGLKVKGLEIHGEFSTQDIFDLKAKYNAPAGGAFDLGGGLSGKFEGASTFVITAPGSAWVLGELAAFSSSGGFAGKGAPVALRAVDISSPTEIVEELQ
jgi:hypothetical protein